VHADYAGFVHEIDHVIAAKHGGTTDLENFAYACAQCNRLKGSDIATLDPHTGQVEPLFNPRRQLWHEHFRLDGPVIVPLSSTGRATERLLLTCKLYETIAATSFHQPVEPPNDYYS
jgi:hypothetical protein